MMDPGSDKPGEGLATLDGERDSSPPAAPRHDGSPPTGSAENPSAPAKSKGPGKGRRTAEGAAVNPRPVLAPHQRLLILDAWLRSKLPAKVFSTIVGVSPHTLYSWKKRFEEDGPAGLEDGTRGAPKGTKLPEPTQRAILMLKSTHPEWGIDRIRDVLLRSQGYGASSGAIQRVLCEAGYEVALGETRPHAEPQPRHFERARPNQLWQSDLFTFMMKRQNRRVYAVVFLDDHSRFVVGWSLQATSSSQLVREAFEASVNRYGLPEEVLTDNGAQYHSWRGKSAFTKLLEKRGVRHIVSRPRHPQTLGKTERFWGTLWRECVESAIFADLDEARTRIGHFVDHYNFQRPHQGIDGLVPADRFFDAAEEVRRTLEARVAQNALDLAQHGKPRKAFYLTGRVGDRDISLHGEGSRVILTEEGKEREEVDLSAPGRRAAPGEPAGLPASSHESSTPDDSEEA
jgi:transposase InsO family protein